jgi:hypothetical protein
VVVRKRRTYSGESALHVGYAFFEAEPGNVRTIGRLTRLMLMSSVAAAPRETKPGW